MPMPPRRSRLRYSSRPAAAALLLLTLIATYALLAPSPRIVHRPNHAVAVAARDSPDQIECRLVHHAHDQCAFVLANCQDDEAGLIHYLAFYYCSASRWKPVAFAILASWLGLLFTTIGIAASDFFTVNLSTIATVLGLSESLAGVTFLAFGNGSPDVFSTLAAMRSNSGSMAVGELIGAAGFITAVVAGSMALVREFPVKRRTFVRDILFFITAIIFTLSFLADGRLHLWECCAMIGFYGFYVLTVVGWHWFTSRRRRMRLRDVASRTHMYSASGRGTEELEPYRDEPDEDDTAPVGAGRSSSAPEAADISILERAPRIEVDGVDVASTSGEEDDEQRGMQVAAEMTSSMRVNRPRWGRSNTTIAPVRPSLVGVLEFRAVLSSLQRARNMQLGPLPERPRGLHQRSSSNVEIPRGRPRTYTEPAHLLPLGARERALSHGDAPLDSGSDVASMSRTEPSTRASSSVRTLDGKLAPPLGSVSSTDHAQPSSRPAQQGGFLQIRIPSPSGHSSGQSSPSLSPFPGLSESPAALTPVHQEQSAFIFPVPSDAHARRASIPVLDSPEEPPPKPISWWPYQMLPPPHVLLGTIFPTLQGWSDKSLWDKVVSLVSVPSIFFLVVTLPVVETESGEEDSEPAGPADAPVAIQPGNMVPLVSTEGDGPVRRETEWQEYRRRARSVSSRSALSPSPSSLSLATAAQNPPADSNGAAPYPLHQPPAKPAVSSTDADAMTTTTEAPSGWNRWLVALQLFTGPLFVVFVIWANNAEDMEQPGKTLVRMVLYSLVVSLSLLACLLVTTTPHAKPKYHFLLCFLGFIISAAWISTIAGEVVGVLKAFGVILGISEAILGLTIFAVGNSLGDLVADITVARLGYPVMALSACFGGPMLNILLGVGIGGAWMTMSSANEKHRAHPQKPITYKPYHIHVGPTLMISAATVLLTLVVLLIVVPSNGWIMSRKIGWLLIGIWSVSTTVNLVIEGTGIWSTVS